MALENYIQFTNKILKNYWYLKTCLLQILYYLNSIPEIEDGYEGERKDAMMKIDSLTSIVKMFELKTKNFQDQSKFMLFYA